MNRLLVVSAALLVFGVGTFAAAWEYLRPHPLDDPWGVGMP